MSTACSGTSATNLGDRCRIAGARESGGTGRRASLRNWCLRAWGFESPLSHPSLPEPGRCSPPTVLGLTWAGYTPVGGAYAWDPAGYLDGMPESAVLGTESPLWSETLEDSMTWSSWRSRGCPPSSSWAGRRRPRMTGPTSGSASPSRARAGTRWTSTTTGHHRSPGRNPPGAGSWTGCAAMADQSVHDLHGTCTAR